MKELNIKAIEGGTSDEKNYSPYTHDHTDI